ncbi:hypothetical protein ACQRIU_002660 [Beauveria bassiana]
MYLEVFFKIDLGCGLEVLAGPVGADFGAADALHSGLVGTPDLFFLGDAVDEEGLDAPGALAGGRDGMSGLLLLACSSPSADRFLSLSLSIGL